MLSDVANQGVASFMSVIKNHLWILDVRTGDTSQTSNGYPVGESMGILPRRQTGVPNNAPYVTVHSSELTQFRKSDSLAPQDGASLLGTIVFPANTIAPAGGVPTMFASIRTGGLTSPKIAFDKTQSLTEFQVYLRSIDGSSGSSSIVQLSVTELRQMTLVCVFRVW